MLIFCYIINQSKHPYLSINSYNFITTGVPQRPARSSLCLPSSWSVADGISLFHKSTTVEILFNLIRLFNICTGLKGPPPSVHCHYHSLIALPITDPLGPSVTSSKMNGPLGTRGREDSPIQLSPANSTDTPGTLICSHASPISPTKYCPSD